MSSSVSNIITYYILYTNCRELYYNDLKLNSVGYSSLVLSVYKKPGRLQATQMAEKRVTNYVGHA